MHSPFLSRPAPARFGANALSLPRRLVRHSQWRTGGWSAAASTAESWSGSPRGQSVRQWLRGRRDMRMTQFARKQRVTIIAGIAAFQMIIVLLQLWLFTTTMETFLAGYQETALPAALASAACFALNGGLFFYLRGLER